MTDRQRVMARHALGFDPEKRSCYRNHFCAHLGSDDYAEWQDLVDKGLAYKSTESMFHLTPDGARAAIKEPRSMNPDIQRIAALVEKLARKYNWPEETTREVAEVIYQSRKAMSEISYAEWEAYWKRPTAEGEGL